MFKDFAFTILPTILSRTMAVVEEKDGCSVGAFIQSAHAERAEGSTDSDTRWRGCLPASQALQAWCVFTAWTLACVGDVIRPVALIYRVYVTSWWIGKIFTWKYNVCVKVTWCAEKCHLLFRVYEQFINGENKILLFTMCQVLQFCLAVYNMA